MSERNILSETSFEITSPTEQSIDFEVRAMTSDFSLEIGTPAAGTVTYNIGAGLSYDVATNTLYVDVSHEILEDSNLPVSSVAILKLLSSYVKVEEGKVLSDNNFTDEYLQKLESLRNYTHPSKHPAEMIEGLSKVATTGKYYDLLGRPTSFPPAAHGHGLEDIEGLVRALASKATTIHEHDTATQESDGFFSSVDKKKLDSIEEGATNYQHPEKHDVSEITGLARVAKSNQYEDLYGKPTSLSEFSQDKDHRLVSDEEKHRWESKANFDGKYSSLSGIPEEFNPASHEHKEYARSGDIDEALSDKADKDAVYTKEEVVQHLSQKADKDNVYNKEETDTKLSQKADKDTVYTKLEIDGKLSGAYRFKGTKDNYSDLPTTGNQVGDTWNILSIDKENGINPGDNVAWDGEKWDILSGIMDLSSYATKDDLKDKADLIEGKVPTSQIPDAVMEGLSTNDYSDEEKQKVADAEKSIGDLQQELQRHISSNEKFDAKRVYFSEDLQTTYEIGSISLENGIATIPAKDKTIEEVWDMIFMKELYPETKLPSITLTASSGSHEVGTEIIPTYKASFNNGSYTYGPEDTGVKVTSWYVVDSRGETSNIASSNFTSLLIGDDTEYTIAVVAYYSEGVIPVTNLGTSYLEGRILAGYTDKISTAVKGYRNSFYGTFTDKSELNSAKIRGLTPSGKSLKHGAKFDVVVPVGAMRVTIAYPATLRDLSSVKDINGLGAEIVSSFEKKIISVAGVDGYDPIEYKVYCLDFADPNDEENKFSVTI